MGEQPAEDALQEKTPPGFEHVVKGLKDNPDVDNPWAVAWWMHNRGYTPHTESGTPRDVNALLRRYRFEKSRDDLSEANSLTALGALGRKGVRESDPAGAQSVRGVIRTFIALRETSPDRAMTDGGDIAPEVIIISAGRGNRRDRNYYPPEALARSVEAFEGAKCFLDHPSRREEEDRPERSVREIAGWFSDVRFDPATESLVGRLHTTSNTAGREAQSLVRDAIRYQRQYPGADKVLCGLSINAEGPSHLEEIDGAHWNVVEGIHRAMSADLVTFPARGGKVLGMREAEQRWRERLVIAPPAYRRGLRMLRERLATEDAALVGDIRYALPFLREALAPPFKRAAARAEAPPEPSRAEGPPDDRAGQDQSQPERSAAAEVPAEKQPLPPEKPVTAEGPPNQRAEEPQPELDGVDPDDLNVPTRDERRLLILDDLSEKAEAAQASHDPQVIRTLLAALTAFLNDEMEEPSDPGYEGRQSAGEADDFAKYAATPPGATPPGWPPEQPPPTSASTEARGGQPGEGTQNAPNAGPNGAGDVAPAGTQNGQGEDKTMPDARTAPADGKPPWLKPKGAPAAAGGNGEEAPVGAEPDQDEPERGEPEPEGAQVAPVAAAAANGAGSNDVTDAARAAGARGDREKAARADRFRRYAQEGGRTMQCEACGYEMHREAVADAGQKVEGAMTEAAKGPAPVGEGSTALRESERDELLRLREQEAYRDRWRRANAAVDEAGVAIDPKRLLAFEDAQWPLLIEAAAAAPRAFIGATEAPPIVPPTRAKPLTARQAFEAQYATE